jgi:YebC/PmpR family DNA-binding regulatory protein
MAGHSKWAGIKRKKAKIDAQRGKVFTRVMKELTIAARMGGGDPDSNARLRTAISNAKAANMPNKNIESAIKKGTGELPGVQIEEFTYEGYGPSGVAVLVETASDNRNRITAEIRHLFSKYNGNMGESGCVSWMFDKKGMFVCSADKYSEEQLMEIALEAGAEDVKREDDVFEILTDPQEFHEIQQVFDEKGIKYESAEITMIPQTTVELTGKQAKTMIKLMEALEENEDVQNVHANFDIPEEEFEDD